MNLSSIIVSFLSLIFGLLASNSSFAQIAATDIKGLEFLVQIFRSLNTNNAISNPFLSRLKERLSSGACCF